ncbi:MAG: LemA family protein [Gammaproteobacteria bacterium]|nr:LemA family protein [Gammaproteobacteria bacterium]
MEIGQFIFWGGFILLLLYVIIIYNALVRIKHNVDAAWSNIEVLLKQRHDELPKLVAVCREYANFEQQTLEKVMQARAAVADARAQGDIDSLGSAEGALRLGLGNLFAVAEAYPELKANENFQHLQVRISGLENSIADRREFYNDSVNINNVSIEQFPDLIVAKMFGFAAKKLLYFPLQETADVDVGKLFT